MGKFHIWLTTTAHEVLGAACLAITVAAVVSTACAPKGAGTITIRGMVTLDGAPLPEGQVVFIPTDPSLGAAGGSIADGVFAITTSKGSHTVQVHAEKRVNRPVPPGAPPEAGITFVSIVPDRYNAKTTLTFDVQSPADKPEFALTSDK